MMDMSTGEDLRELIALLAEAMGAQPQQPPPSRWHHVHPCPDQEAPAPVLREHWARDAGVGLVHRA
jgi:hypothetical protein